MDDLSASASTQSFNSFPNVAESALIDDAMYRAMYEASIRDPETFWGEHGKRIDWIRPYSRVKNCSFANPDVSINGSRTAPSTSRPTASTAISRSVVIRSPSSGNPGAA
jgi:Acetyl-coenzyme A synthetase N-terminus